MSLPPGRDQGFLSWPRGCGRPAEGGERQVRGRIAERPEAPNAPGRKHRRKGELNVHSRTTHKNKHGNCFAAHRFRFRLSGGRDLPCRLGGQAGPPTPAPSRTPSIAGPPRPPQPHSLTPGQPDSPIHLTCASGGRGGSRGPLRKPTQTRGHVLAPHTQWPRLGINYLFSTTFSLNRTIRVPAA